MSKKILFLGNNLTGMKNFRLQLMLRCKDIDHEVLICAPKGKPEILEIFAKHNLHYIPLDFKRAAFGLFDNLRFFCKLFKILLQNRPDILINYTIKPVIFGSLAAYFCKINSTYSFITGLGYVFIGNNIKRKMLRMFVCFLYFCTLRFNKKIFFLNKDDLVFFVNNKIINRNKATLINGEGVDINYYFPLTLPDRCSFLFIGRLIIDKGIYEYINAARILKRYYPFIRFLVVGNLDDNPASLNESELNNLISSGVVEYLGVFDDIRVIFEQTSVFVLPSYREGIPRTILEAMALGRPIITTDVPGCKETVIDGKNGFLIPAKDIKSLANSMEKFILNQQLIFKMGKESRNLAIEKYDVHNVNRMILKNLGLL